MAKQDKKRVNTREKPTTSGETGNSLSNKRHPSMDYKSKLRYSQTLMNKAAKVKRQIKALQKDIVNYHDGIYDKPLAIEMQEQYAYLSYMLTSSVYEASLVSRVPINKITSWVQAQRWDLDKQSHYENVRTTMKNYLEEEVVDYQASFAAKLWERAHQLLDTIIDDESMTPIEQATAIEKITSQAMRIEGWQEEKTSQAPQSISQVAQNILINFNQQLNVDDNKQANPDSNGNINEPYDDDIIEIDEDIEAIEAVDEEELFASLAAEADNGHRDKPKDKNKDEEQLTFAYPQQPKSNERQQDVETRQQDVETRQLDDILMELEDIEDTETLVTHERE